MNSKQQMAMNRVNALLAPLHAAMQPRVHWYKGAKRVASVAFTDGRVQTPRSQWTCQWETREVAGESDAIDVQLAFCLTQGFAPSAGVAVAFDFSDWSTDNYVLIPASVYNGNRNRIEYRDYCTGFDQRDFYNRDMPVTHGDVPRLELAKGVPSKIEVLVSNTATPAILVYSRKTKRAFVLLTEQGMREGVDVLDHGLVVEENADRTRASVILSAPGVRERKPEFIGFSPSPDRGIDWKQGKIVTLKLRVYVFESPDIPGVLNRFFHIRKAVTGPNHPRNLIPFSEISRLMTGRIDSRWYEQGGYYCPENSTNLCIGWIGGLMNTFPMIALGDELHRTRVTQTFDFALPPVQGKSGYLLATVHPDGKASGRDWFPNQPIVLTRQVADALFWLVKQFQVLKAQGHPVKPTWEQVAKRLADAFVRTWKRHGQWGNYVNHETGDIAIYNSTSGAMAIGGLALASFYFQQPEYLRIAKEAATHYYRADFVAKGFTYGACSDIMQNADSETAAALMTSLMTLFEVDGNRKWLEMSRQVANLLATWAVSFDYELPKGCDLDVLGAKMAGVVWASTQNKHGAPGICTSSGDALFKIYRATGDRRYAELMRDIVHAHAEGIQPDGKISERLTYCDADSRGTRGAPGGTTGWTELNGFLMALELPGIYVRTDRDELVVFDHVEARVLARTSKGVTLQIHNPTKFDARVALLTESASDARKPLGVTSFLNWPKVEVPSGATIRTTVGKHAEF